MRRLAALGVFALPLLLPAQGEKAPGADAWKFDVVHRKAGEPLRGLIVSHTPEAVTIRCVSRRAGYATVVITEVVPRRDIARLDELAADDRAALRARLEKLKAERDLLAARLRALGPRARAADRADEPLDLQPAGWPGDKSAKALGYRSGYFTLTANASPELAQLVAIQLEQVYAAYARALPPRHPKAAPTAILVTRSLADYQALARARGLNLLSPAFYDPARNQVVCGSDLERLRDERERVAKHHEQLRGQMKARRAELMKLYRNKVPAELLGPLAAAERRIADAEKKNDETFQASRQRLFRRLYHEAFHAYVGTFVYPAKEGALPLWLDEGLAQVFEAALVEAGELRVRHAEPKRLAAVRQALADGTLLPLADLLAAQGKDFQVAHASEKQLSDRHYLAAWALAFHITFERKLLGTKELDGYVAALKRGTAPAGAFRDLIGGPLPAYEKQWRAYLGKLKPDGTAAGP